MRKNISNKTFDPKIAIVAADSFRNNAHIFISKLDVDVNKAHITASKDLGGLISSATMMALSIELYLKVLKMIHHHPIKAIHNLFSIYQSLPEDLKVIIESRYNEQNPLSGDQTSEIEIAIDTGNVNNTELESWNMREYSKKGVSLEEVLKRSGDAFVNWRYFHEQDDHNQLIVLNYEFTRLSLIAHVLREIAVKLLQRREKI